jgi:hypothetical protein
MLDGGVRLSAGGRKEKGEEKREQIRKNEIFHAEQIVAKVSKRRERLRVIGWEG